MSKCEKDGSFEFQRVLTTIQERDGIKREIIEKISFEGALTLRDISDWAFDNNFDIGVHTKIDPEDQPKESANE